MDYLKLIYKNEITIKPISLLKSFFIIGVYILVQNISNLVSMIVTMLINPYMSFGSIMIFSMIATAFMSIAMVILSSNIFTEKNIIERNNTKIKFDKKVYLNISLIIIGYILIREAVLFEALSKFEGPIPDEMLELLVENSTDIEMIILSATLIIQTLIVAPIIEELFFRGILLNGFVSKYKTKPKKAIVYSSLIFAIMHLNIPQGVNAFIGGVILGGIYYYTKSMKLAVFAHFLNNLIVFMPVPSTIIVKFIYIGIGLYCMIKGIKYIKNAQEKTYIRAIES